VAELWDPTAAGVLALPSGRLVRGRALRRPLPAGPTPVFAVHLLGRTPPAVPWESRWLRWPDFRLPTDRGTPDSNEVWSAPPPNGEVACGGARRRARRWPALPSRRRTADEAVVTSGTMTCARRRRSAAERACSTAAEPRPLQRRTDVQTLVVSDAMASGSGPADGSRPGPATTPARAGGHDRRAAVRRVATDDPLVSAASGRVAALFLTPAVLVDWVTAGG
jgi:hypothetical protein